MNIENLLKKAHHSKLGHNVQKMFLTMRGKNIHPSETKNLLQTNHCYIQFAIVILRILKVIIGNVKLPINKVLLLICISLSLQFTMQTPGVYQTQQTCKNNQNFLSIFEETPNNHCLF